MIIVNPYKNVDWAKTERVKAITHEHIFNKARLTNAYNRGVRYFACVDYQPAVPSYPLSGWEGEFEDYTSPDDLTIIKRKTSGSVTTITDSKGNTIHTDDLVQLPNAEHPVYCYDKDSDKRIIGHFNVLGSLFCEVGWGQKWDDSWSSVESLTKWRSKHPLYDVDDINQQYLNESTHLFKGKLFGTINHTSSYNYCKTLLDKCPNIFRAMEVFNDGYSDEETSAWRNTWDRLLSEGYRIWGTSVADWANIARPDGRPKIGECNILLINDYPDKTNLEKSELGLDAFIHGCYIPTANAKYFITDFSVNDSEGTINLSVEGNPQSIIVVTNLGKTSYSNTNRVNYKIQKGVSFVRFEVWYFDYENDIVEDFLFTNPIFIEGNEDVNINQYEVRKRRLLVLESF